MYTIKITSKAAATTADMATMKATETTPMALMNRQKRSKRLGGGGDSGVDNDTEEVVPFNGSFFKKLVQIVPGQSVQDHIIKLKSIHNSPDVFAAILSNPKKLMEGRLEKLELNGCPVQVFSYPTFVEVSEIEDAFKAFYSRYGLTVSTKSQLQKFPAISNFISIDDHCCITGYTLESPLCGKQGCIVCAKIGHDVRTPDISIRVNNI